ncbi:Phospholipid-transporting ATPase 2 [Senna tora]|uniref:Phospholipid-transporting ATPase 2 n=1 Tax=Senna tora TaxID=362788 RepID=A0A834SD05_9FABA|nr:Phospholipid-transporting ATPase 2 [Senna tora]
MEDPAVLLVFILKPIDGKTKDEVPRSLERVLLTMRKSTSEPKDVAFVVDGWALEIGLNHYRKAFIELAIFSRTAICCRVTPSQKAQTSPLHKRTANLEKEHGGRKETNSRTRRWES